jgi:hypothetical protein
MVKDGMVVNKERRACVRVLFAAILLGVDTYRFGRVVLRIVCRIFSLRHPR